MRAQRDTATRAWQERLRRTGFGTGLGTGTLGVRLEEAVTALTDEPQTGYQLSFSLFGRELPAAGRRFAIAETLSHYERLVHAGAAGRSEVDGAVTYTAA